MSIFSKKNNIYFAISSLLLFFIIIWWGNYIIKNYFIECFTSQGTSHTVDLPLTTSYSCKNFCGPTARCSITGTQCTADIDCYGCQPYTPPLKKTNTNIPGDNDAGKLTFGVTPQYSPLTSGYGTQEKIISKNVFSKPYMPNFGINTWITQFKEENKLFDDRYKPKQSSVKHMPNYPKRYNLSGEFSDYGPLPSNAYL